MLVCDICGEEVLLEDDMKTHVLLSHVEDRLQCPLCSLSGVSYDQLGFHIAAAHPEPPRRAESSSRPDTAGDAGRPSAAQAASRAAEKAWRRGDETCGGTRSEHSSADRGREFECPVCWTVCRDGCSLQEHVELHFQNEAAPSCAESCSSDRRLALQLQRREESQQEQQEFTELQV